MSWLETRKISVLFAVATLLPIAALCWLGLRTLQQDRDLERQRRRERLEVEAGRSALGIEQDLQRLEATLAAGDGIRFLSTGIVAPDDEPLVFRPDVPSVSVLTSEQLVAAARLEDRNPLAAIAAYQRIVDSRADPDRGEALVALGGLFRRQRHFDDALRVYDQLAELGPLPVAGGQPAALVALQGRGKTFLESDDQVRLREEAVSFARALSRGGWLIDRASFDLYQREMVEPWGGRAADSTAVQRAECELWRDGRMRDDGRFEVTRRVEDPADAAVEPRTRAFRYDFLRGLRSFVPFVVPARALHRPGRVRSSLRPAASGPGPVKEAVWPGCDWWFFLLPRCR